MWGDDFHKKNSNFRKKILFDFFFQGIFKCYYCSINLKRQSEHSGLRPDTSSLVECLQSLCAHHCEAVCENEILIVKMQNYSSVLDHSENELVHAADGQLIETSLMKTNIENIFDADHYYFSAQHA